MNEDWDIYESLKQDNGELKARYRRLYYFLDEIMNDVFCEHGEESPVYKKLKNDGFFLTAFSQRVLKIT